MPVLLAAPAGDADAASNPAADDDRNTAIDGHRPLEPKEAEALSSGRDTILKDLRRPPEQRRRACLFNRDVHASDLRVIHLLEIDKVPAGVDDGDGHVPVVLPCLG